MPAIHSICHKYVPTTTSCRNFRQRRRLVGVQRWPSLKRARYAKRIGDTIASSVCAHINNVGVAVAAGIESSRS